MIIVNVPFVGIKYFMKQKRRTSSFFLLEIIADYPGIKYIFPDGTIGYQPKNPHWGEIKLVGKDLHVMLFYEEIRNFLKRFRKNRFDPKFVAHKELMDYCSCKAVYELYHLL